MRSKPKAYAIGVVVLEIIFCFLIYLCCVYVRRKRCGHKLRDVFRSSKGGVDEVSGLRLSTDSSVLVFFPYSALKSFDHAKTMRLRCTSCLRELNNDDETLRLIPKCGHVFHPLCLIDPCSALCPCCKNTCELGGPDLRSDTDEMEPEHTTMHVAKAKDGSINKEDGLEAQAVDEIEVATEVKAKPIVVNGTVAEAMEVTLDIDLLEEKIMTKLPKEIMEKIVGQGKVVSPAGEVYSRTRYFW